MASLGHVRDSVKQIDENSWLIGTKHIVRKFQEPCDGEDLWEYSRDGLWYTCSDAPATIPDTGPLPPNSHVRQIHDAGDASAVFQFGTALVLKVKLVNKGVQQENETLAFLAKQHLSFKVPSALFHFKDADRTYLFETFMPGEALNKAWWNMDENGRENVSSRIAQICAELKVFESNAMTGVEDGWIDPFREPDQCDYSPKALQKHCQELGMDCSTYVFSHNDLGPTNVLIDGDQFTVIDWDMAGYFPLAWVRTKFGICGALDVERIVDDSVETDKGYRVKVEQKLRDKGFPEVIEAYQSLWKARAEEWKKQRPWLQ